MQSPEKKTFTETIKEIKNEYISVDFNHPLTGKNLLVVVIH